MPELISQLKSDLAACQICRVKFQDTATAHEPRPVIWFNAHARILIAGQAPGQKVYQSGQPFTDPSGDRLRDWMGIDKSVFYDQDRIAIVPMAFCFPGYNSKGSDLPPPRICAQTWHRKIMTAFQNISLTILVGGYAQEWHLGQKSKVQHTVEGWQKHAPDVFPLPHPSWRNSGWLKRNPWFETDLVPALQARVRTVLDA